MPLGRRELKPVRKALEPGGFARCDYAVSRWVDGAHRLKTTTVRPGACSQSGTKAIQIQASGFRDVIHFVGCKSSVSVGDFGRMERAEIPAGLPFRSKPAECD